MSNQIPLIIRSISAGLHTIFAVPMGSFLLFVAFVLVSELNPENHNILGLVIISLLFGLPMTIILPIVLLITWQITRRIHPFINASGKDVLNYSLNSLVVILFSAFVTYTIYGIIATIDLSTYTLFTVGAIIINSVATSYFINAVIGGIFAFRGHRWHNRLIYPFIRDE
jgi:uncharacterized Tic20 family protein